MAGNEQGRSGRMENKNKVLPHKAATSDIKVHTTPPSSIEKAKPTQIADDTKCPIHLNSNHTWGECFSNIANKDKPRLFFQKRNNAKSTDNQKRNDGHIMDVADTDQSAGAMISPCDDDKHQETGPHCINDESMAEEIKDMTNAAKYAIGSRNFYIPRKKNRSTVA
jgi:hypothetical protein